MTPRPRDAGATRRAILDAAALTFTARGYDGVGVREIAGQAGVDARLITRYFGSKEGLFAAVVAESYEKPLLMAPGHNHEAAVALLSDEPRARDALLLTVRCSANERAAEIMCEHLEQHYQKRLAEALPGDHAAGRAALLVGICAGVQQMRMILRNSALQGAPAPELVRRLEAALDAVACA
jgi:AcrR family transcriptional regulator